MSIKIPLTRNFLYGSQYNPYSYIPPHIRKSLGSAAMDVTPVSSIMDVTPVSSSISLKNLRNSDIVVSSPINNVILDNVILNNTMSKNILFPYPVTPIGPLYDSVDYDSVDNDSELRSKMTKYFYEKTFNSWLIQNAKLLRYFKVSGEKVSMVKNKSEYEKNNIKHDEKKQIVKYILENIFDKYDIKSTLKIFVSRSRSKWFELKDNKEYVIKFIMKRIKKKLKQHYNKL